MVSGNVNIDMSNTFYNPMQQSGMASPFYNHKEQVQGNVEYCQLRAKSRTMHL